MSGRPKRKNANLHPGLILVRPARPRRSAAEMEQAHRAQEDATKAAQDKRDATNQQIAEVAATTREHVSTEAIQSGRPLDESRLTVKLRKRTTGRQATAHEALHSSQNVASLGQPMAVDIGSSTNVRICVLGQASIATDSSSLT